LALFYIFLFYDLPFLHARNLEQNLLFSTLIFGSVFGDYVVFYGVTVNCKSNALTTRLPSHKLTHVCYLFILSGTTMQYIVQ